MTLPVLFRCVLRERTAPSTSNSRLYNLQCRQTHAMCIKTVDNSKDKAVLKSAPPPWHSVLLVAIFTVYFLARLPRWEQLQSHPERFTTSYDDRGLDRQTIGLLRALFAVIIFTTSVVCMCGPGWDILPPYLKGSKLQRVPIRMSGWKTMLPFTSWCWNILGVSFALNSYLALSSSSLQSSNLMGAATLLWEVAAPCALLVSAVVKHALWPAAVRQNTGHALNGYRNLLMHNANAAFVLIEYALLSGMPVHWNHLSVAPLYGVCYLLFTWNVNTMWAPNHGPQYIYFFFDTTQSGAFHSVVIAVLLSVLLLFYGLFAHAHYMLDDGSLLTRLVFCGCISGAVMRFRD